MKPSSGVLRIRESGCLLARRTSSSSVNAQEPARIEISTRVTRDGCSDVVEVKRGVDPELDALHDQFAAVWQLRAAHYQHLIGYFELSR